MLYIKLYGTRFTFEYKVSTKNGHSEQEVTYHKLHIIRKEKIRRNERNAMKKKKKKNIFKSPMSMLKQCIYITHYFRAENPIGSGLITCNMVNSINK